MDREEVIKDLKLTEMQQHNPKLVEEIQGQASTVSEMTNVRKVLGIKETDDASKAIAEVQQTIREQELDSELRSKVKLPAARPIIRSLTLAECDRRECRECRECREHEQYAGTSYNWLDAL